MDFIEKAKIQIEHWIRHNKDHIEEYEAFARDLENADKKESAGYIWNMATLVAQSTEHLEKALRSLG